MTNSVPTCVSIDRRTFADIESRIKRNDFLSNFGKSSETGNQFVTKHTFDKGEFLVCELLQGKLTFTVSPLLLDQHLLTKKK